MVLREGTGWVGSGRNDLALMDGTDGMLSVSLVDEVGTLGPSVLGSRVARREATRSRRTEASAPYLNGRKVGCRR